jgi:hypothetical protein
VQLPARLFTTQGKGCQRIGAKPGTYELLSRARQRRQFSAKKIVGIKRPDVRLRALPAVNTHRFPLLSVILSLIVALIEPRS